MFNNGMVWLLNLEKLYQTLLWAPNPNHFIHQVSSPLAVQHSSTQSTPTKKKTDETEHVTQKQIMKSERARKEEKKEGLMNFKNKFEDSTQSRVSYFHAYIKRSVLVKDFQI